jgi:hypothetical protein
MAEFSKFQYGVTAEKDITAEKEKERENENTMSAAEAIEDKDKDNEKSTDKTTEKRNDKTSDINDKTETENNESHILQKFRFPLGSVVAKVEIFFLADEEYETTLEGSNTHIIIIQHTHNHHTTHT